MYTYNMKTLLTTGDWGHSTFEAYLDLDGDFEPLRSSVTAVACVCFTHEGRIVLTQHIGGGFDLLGGKVEQGETIEDALHREALEEAGVLISEWRYFGFYKIKQQKDASREYVDRYPAESYILFFITKGRKVKEPTGEEIMDSKEFTVGELKNTKILDHVMLKEAIKLHSLDITG